MLQVDGINVGFILTLLSEVGMDLSKFPSEKHFVSWLSLSPNKKVSGGKTISSRTRKNKNRLSQAFKQAVISLGKKKDSALAHFYRRMAAKHGKGTAITATARKLAIIVFNMLQKGQNYQPQDLEQYQQKVRNQKLKRIQRTIKALDVKNTELIFS